MNAGYQLQLKGDGHILLYIYIWTTQRPYPTSLDVIWSSTPPQPSPGDRPLPRGYFYLILSLLFCCDFCFIASRTLAQSGELNVLAALIGQNLRWEQEARQNRKKKQKKTTTTTKTNGRKKGVCWFDRQIRQSRDACRMGNLCTGFRSMALREAEWRGAGRLRAFHLVVRRISSIEDHQSVMSAALWQRWIACRPDSCLSVLDGMSAAFFPVKKGHKKEKEICRRRTAVAVGSPFSSTNR